jgi:hypothetical protein
LVWTGELECRILHPLQLTKEELKK